MLIVRNVKVDYYGEQTTLNFAFEKGITLVLGETGSFKTTLLRVIGGIKIIEDGEIVLDGVNIEEKPPRERNMALVGSDSLPYGSVLSALMQPLRLRKTPRKEAKAIALSTMEKFALKNGKVMAIDKLAFFSARLSLRSTSVTMFDEPYHFLGDDATELIYSRGGYTIVTSCDGSDISKLCPDYLFVVRQNKVLQCGPTAAVLSCPISKYVELLLKL